MENNLLIKMSALSAAILLVGAIVLMKPAIKQKMGIGGKISEGYATRSEKFRLISSGYSPFSFLDSGLFFCQKNIEMAIKCFIIKHKKNRINPVKNHAPTNIIGSPKTPTFFFITWLGFKFLTLLR